MHTVADTPLAIIGMGCRLPGADNLDEFWQMLLGGRCGLGELPADRFNRELYYHPKKSLRNKSYTSQGGVVPPRPFDRNLCPLPEHLIERSHATHLQLAEVAADALRRAGLDPRGLRGRRIGVYIGHTPPSALAGRMIYARQIAHTAQWLRDVPGFDELAAGRQDEIISEIVEAVRAEFAPDDKAVTMRANA
ncbi:MAG: beta-ketoacyl synthase N-terminal-like domain-containing protein, partial [Planctomycetaceae bacterium]